MFAHSLLAAVILLQSTVAANLLSSGVFLVRILSEQRLRVQYCFTELPYPMKSVDRECLKSGQLEIIDRTETVLDLRITNLTAEYLTVVFEVVGSGGRPIRRLANRVTVDGALPAERIAIAKGIVMDFVTVCDRPFYGIMCARQCFERDGANYICDPRGEKVCLVGWTGKDCDIALTDVSIKKSVEFSSSTPSLTSTSTGRLPTKDTDTTKKSSHAFESTTQSPVSSTKTPLVKRPAPIVPVPGFPVHAFEVFYRARPTVPPLSKQPASNPGPILTGDTSAVDLAMVPTSTSAATSVSTPSVVDYILAVFIIAVLTGVTACAIAKMVRSPLMQNWINQRRTRVFAADRPTVPVEVISEKSKGLLIDMKAGTPRKTCEEQLPAPRYSSSPRRDKEQPSVCDSSLVTESNTYHEIDSFLVQPVSCDELRLTTLV